MLVNEQYPKLKNNQCLIEKKKIFTSSESYLVTSLIARIFGLVAEDAKRK
jgi:hypothetical protein